MTTKSSRPKDLKLTLKTARDLAKRELGTARGLTQERATAKGWFYMMVGNLTVCIHPEGNTENGYIVMTAGWASGMCETTQLFDPRTLEKDFMAENDRHLQEKRSQLEDWVDSYGVEACCQKVKEVWDKQR